MKVNELINEKIISKYFILDSHLKSDDQNDSKYDDIDFAVYRYNPQQNNKLISYSAFLYRRPGKDFSIFGGGVIDNISESNQECSAHISHGFKLKKPLKKGDEKLEKFEWERKQKPGPGWKGFFTNYGILEITKNDFWNLVSDLECESAYPNLMFNIPKTQEDDFNLIEEVNTIYALEKACSFDSQNTLISQKKPKVKETTYYSRNRNTALKALDNANHKCEVDSKHPSFKRKNSEHQYCEPHHLIPMHSQSQPEFTTKDLDVEANIVCLCSNCHNQIHYGEDAEKLIKTLYEKRKSKLQEAGIDIGIDKLLNIYNIPNKKIK